MLVFFSANVQSIPVASNTVLGAIKIGSGLQINSSTGVASLDLPYATANTLGGVKIGTGLSIDNSGVLSTSASAIGIASPTTLGGIKNGPTLIVDQTTGVANVAQPTSQLGGVIIGSGLAVTASGVLGATGGGTSGGGTLSSRTTVSGTTILLADNTYDTLNLTGFKSYALLKSIYLMRHGVAYIVVFYKN